MARSIEPDFSTTVACCTWLYDCIATCLHIRILRLTRNGKTGPGIGQKQVCSPSLFVFRDALSFEILGRHVSVPDIREGKHPA